MVYVVIPSRRKTLRGNVHRCSNGKKAQSRLDFRGLFSSKDGDGRQRGGWSRCVRYLRIRGMSGVSRPSCTHLDLNDEQGLTDRRVEYTHTLDGSVSLALWGYVLWCPLLGLWQSRRHVLGGASI